VGHLCREKVDSLSCFARRKSSGNGQESADVDVDLSPQVNTALRSEILYYTTSGIKESVRAVNDEIIDIPISGESEPVRGHLRQLQAVAVYVSMCVLTDGIVVLIASPGQVDQVLVVQPDLVPEHSPHVWHQ